MKTCFRCGTEKPPTEFYRHPQMGDGHLGKCKRCTRIDVRQNRAAKREQYREYDRMRSQKPERLASIHASSNKDALKVWARKATQSALSRGVLQRLACEVCGDQNTDAHHEDYSRPLDVRWLCRQHHMEAHYPLEESA